MTRLSILFHRLAAHAIFSGALNAGPVRIRS